MKTDALVTYLRLTQKLAIRASGFLKLAQDSCKGCSALPDNINPALVDMGDVADREEKLIEFLLRAKK